MFELPLNHSLYFYDLFPLSPTTRSRSFIPFYLFICCFPLNSKTINHPKIIIEVVHLDLNHFSTKIG